MYNPARFNLHCVLTKNHGCTRAHTPAALNLVTTVKGGIFHQLRKTHLHFNFSTTHPSTPAPPPSPHNRALLVACETHSTESLCVHVYACPLRTKWCRDGGGGG